MPDNEIARKMFLFSNAAAVSGDSVVRPEIQLIERVRLGDAEAFAGIYRMFAPLVHGIVLARVPHDEVEDIVQDVFLAAHRNLHTLRDKAAVGGWLSRPGTIEDAGPAATPGGVKITRATALVMRRKRVIPQTVGKVAQTAALTREEKYAYGQLMLALSITGSNLKIVQDTINGIEDKESASTKNER